MRVVSVHRNYRSGGVAITGNRPQALAPDPIGVTAITPSTPSTPSIHSAEQILEPAGEHTPNALHLLGDIHAVCRQMGRSLAEVSVA